ncbi:MAG: hypothetical protein IPK72_12440 [Candidatus Eisenbacteria bacterium]|nr:hypothetical protein [Candidatus Eisenbacteria bacterium]
MIRASLRPGLLALVASCAVVASPVSPSSARDWSAPAAAPETGHPESAPLRRLESNRSGEVRGLFESSAPLTGGFADLTPLRVSVTADRGLRVDDPDHPAAPFTPHLSGPTITQWVALPPGAGASLRLQVLESEPLPWPAELTAAEREVILAELPQQAATLDEPCWMRNAFGARISFFPVLRDGAEGLRYVRQATFAVTTLQQRGPGSEEARSVREATGRDPFEPLYRRLFLNYEEGKAWRRADSNLALPRGGDSFASSPNPWVRVRVKKEDLYEVTGQDLEDLGINLATITAESFRLFAPGHLALDESGTVSEAPSWMEEVAISVETGSDLTFDRADRVLFYGVGPDNWYSQYAADETLLERHYRDPYNNTNVYWLTWGGSFTQGAPRRMATVDGTAAEPPYVTAVVDRVHLEEDGVNKVYDARPRELFGLNVPPFATWERFWWIGFLGERGSNDFTLRRRIPDPIVDQPVRAQVRLWGRNNTNGQSRFPDHHMTVSLNGHRVGERKWNDVRRQDLDSTGVWLAEGDQEFRFLQTLYEDSTVVARVDRVLLAWIELDYTRQLKAHDDTLSVFTGGLSGTLSLEAAGFSRDDIRVLDVSAPRTPRWITPRVEGSGSARTARLLYDATGQAEAPGRLLFRAGGAVASPAGFELDRIPEGGYLRDRTAASPMIVITHQTLRDEAERLANFRATHFPHRGQATVTVVDVQDVFDEFAFGRSDPAAIRNFLQFARSNWTGGDPDDAPAYVLFAGDAHYDPRGFMRETGFNLIPTYEGYFDWRQVNGIYAPYFSSDDFYGFLDPVPDTALDLYMGRLPAETPADLEAMVDKIIAYETPELDPWKSHVTLIADDRCQGVNPDQLAYEHTEQTEELAVASLPPEIQVDKVYLLEYGADCVYTLKPAATEATIKLIKAGTLVVNYTGHGSEGQIADERVLDRDDVASLTNSDRPFLFITASCSVGKYDFTGEGLAESLMRSTAGGAVGTFAAAAIAFSDVNARLNREFFRCMFPTGSHTPIEPLGYAATCGKVVIEQPGSIHARRYILLGDPSMSLALPDHRIEMSVSSQGEELNRTLPRGSLVELNGRVTDSSGSPLEAFTGTAEVVVLDSAQRRFYSYRPNVQVAFELPGAPIYRGTAQVTQGEFQLVFHTPSALRIGDRGDAAIYAYAQNGTVDAAGALDSLAVPESAGPPSDDRSGPTLQVALSGDPNALPAGAEFTAELFDSSGINITSLVPSRSVVQRVEADGSLITIEDVSSRVTFGHDYRRGALTGVIPSNLAVGRRYQLILEASDNLNNRSSATIEFFLAGGGDGAFALSRGSTSPIRPPGRPDSSPRSRRRRRSG